MANFKVRVYADYDIEAVDSDEACELAEEAFYIDLGLDDPIFGFPVVQCSWEEV